MLEVLRPGALTTIQDFGRVGWAHLGVPRSGALDRPALTLANALVGNAPDAAGLEITLTGCTVRFAQAATIAVTGASAVVTVAGRVAAVNTALAVRATETVTIGAARAGVRSYLAVGGGIEVAPVLGSRSTDTLSGLGPRPLRAGDLLPTGDVSVAGTLAHDREAVSDPAAPVELPIRPGPRDDWFAAGALEALCGATYRMSTQSNRVGARLTGAAIVRSRRAELPSEGLVLGAVQITPDGSPIVFLADHPTTGGYPVIGVVDALGVNALAQVRPGAPVIFRQV